MPNVMQRGNISPVECARTWRLVADVERHINFQLPVTFKMIILIIWYWLMKGLPRDWNFL